MNHARRHRHGTMISCLAFVALAGCAEYKAENPALTEYPGIQSQIENFYDANATEDDWICDSPQMNTIDKSQVVSQSATQVRIAVTYYFQSSVLRRSRAATSARASTPASSPSTREPAAS